MTKLSVPLSLNFQDVLDSLDAAVMVMDKRLEIIYANAAYSEITERSLKDMIGKHVAKVFNETPGLSYRPDMKLEDLFPSAPRHIERRAEFDYKGRDGTSKKRVFKYANTPQWDSDGTLSYVIHRVEDITDTVLLQRRNELISQELDHRVKNMFSIVMAVAALTGHESETIEDYKKAFHDRLVSMARAHTSLAENNWRGLTFDKLLELELAQYRLGDNTRIDLKGGKVRLSRTATQDCSMIVHEMATNAAKYGCFSDPDGRLSICWEIDQANNELVVEWTESGLHGITLPDHHGFGTALVDLFPAVEIQRDWRDEGLHAIFRARIDAYHLN